MKSMVVIHLAGDVVSQIDNFLLFKEHRVADANCHRADQLPTDPSHGENISKYNEMLISFLPTGSSSQA